MLRNALLGALVAAALAPRAAAADEVDASLMTLFSGRQDPRDGEVHTVVPVYEMIGLSARELDNPWVNDLHVKVSAWGAIDGAGDNFDDATDGDVDLAFAQGLLWRRRVSVTVGRQILTGGAPRFLHFDGLDVGVNLGKGFGVAAFGGAPVVPRFDVGRGDAVAGTRASLRLAPGTELGASFLLLMDGGRRGRQDVAADAVVRATRSLDFQGLLLWSTLENRPAEIDATAVWRHGRRLDVSGGYRLTAPDLFISRASIFSVFSEEQHHEVGGDVTVRALDWLRLEGDGHYLALEGGDGYRAGLGARAIAPDGDGTAGVNLRRLAVDTDGYLEARLFATRALGYRLSAAADVGLYRFDEPKNGQDMSITATGAVTWKAANHWDAALSGMAGSTPLSERHFEVMARLVYSLELRHTENKP